MIIEGITRYSVSVLNRPTPPDDDEAWDRLGGGPPDASGSVFDIVNARGRIQGVRIRGVDYPAPDRITQTRWLNYWQAKTTTALEDCDRVTSFRYGIIGGIVTGAVVSGLTAAAANAVRGANHALAAVTYVVLAGLLLWTWLYFGPSMKVTSRERAQLELVRLAYAKHRPVGGQ